MTEKVCCCCCIRSIKSKDTETNLSVVIDGTETTKNHNLSSKEMTATTTMDKRIESSNTPDGHIEASV